jgi:hypothetical protein
VKIPFPAEVRGSNSHRETANACEVSSVIELFLRPATSILIDLAFLFVSNCPILVPNPTEVTTFTGIAALPAASGHVLETYCNCFAKPALPWCQSKYKTRSRRCWHHKAWLRPERSLFKPRILVSAGVCLAGSGLYGLVWSSPVRTARDLCGPLLKYPSAMAS